MAEPGPGQHPVKTFKIRLLNQLLKEILSRLIGRNAGRKNTANSAALQREKRDIIDVLEGIAYGRSSVYMANRTKELVHAIFNWAVKRDVLEYNPAAGIDDFAGQKPRQRYLSPTEINKLWKAAPHKLTLSGRVFYHLLLIWGMRPG